MDENDWDLMAVVRSCSKERAPASWSKDGSNNFYLPMHTPPPSPPPLSPPFPMPVEFPDHPTSRGSFGGGLEEIYMPFLARRQQPQQLQQQQQQQSLVPKPLPRPQSAVARSKERKSRQNKVVTKVPVDCGGSNDNWAWRKYGQKPIKGSPHPRGYYRCSTSKSCPARKRVEKSWAEPGMFIVTYTAEHDHALPTHRNSLAGTTLGKLHPAANNGGAGNALPRQHSPPDSDLSPTASSTTSPSTDEEEDEEEADKGMLQVEDMEIAGEDELVFLGADASATDGCKMVLDAAFFDDNDDACP